MAGISFLDLLFAEAMASGMAREARSRQRPPPDNFFLLPRDPLAWEQIKTACKKESMVIAVEITDGSSENCLRMQPLFVDLAREHDGMPFLRVKIGLGCSFEQVCCMLLLYGKQPKMSILCSLSLPPSLIFPPSFSLSPAPQ